MTDTRRQNFVENGRLRFSENDVANIAGYYEDEWRLLSPEDKAYALRAYEEDGISQAVSWEDGVPSDYDELAYDAGFLTDDEWQESLLHNQLLNYE